MTNKRPPVPVIVAAVLVILAVSGYFIWKSLSQNQTSVLTASGTIESSDNTASPEIAGKVIKVNADEGDSVKTGDILIELDGSVLKAQRNVAAASLASAQAAVTTTKASLAAAQAQYAIILQASLNADATTRKKDWKSEKPSEFDQPNWFFTRSEEMQNAENQVTATAAGVKEKTEQLQAIESKITNSEFITTEKELLNARQSFNIANDVLDTANGAQNYAELHDSAQANYDAAKKRLYAAQNAYDKLVSSKQADEILSARADVRVAQETYDTAMDFVRSLKTGTSSLELAAAQTAVDQAQAASEQAQTTVGQAQANLNLIETQLKQLAIPSPTSGVVLTRLVEPGDVVTPGYSAMTISDLTNISITVYVPEDRIGEVTLGQATQVSVDSFPGENFQASVIHISDKAEFTPRNVQTVEGRKNTVFAVKLKVENASGKLKPGMPADVRFK